MFETRSELKTKLTASEAEVTRLKEELTAALAKAESSADQTRTIAELTADLEEAKDELKAECDAHLATKEASKSELDAAKNELETEKAKTTPEAIQALVTEEVTKAGHAPIENIDGNPSTSNEPKLSELTGLAKAIAAQKAKLDKK